MTNSKDRTELESLPEQPNTNTMIIKTIQGLITVILNNIAKLPNSKLRGQALEDMDLFEKTTLFELQKEFQ